MTEEEKVRAKEARPWYFYLLPVLVLVFAVVAGGIGYLLANQAIEREKEEISQQHQIQLICESQNETKKIVFGVLEFLAQPRDDDEPGEYEDRQELLEHFRESLAPEECPHSNHDLE